jgi:hypothetical protein
LQRAETQRLIFGASGFPMANLAGAISVQGFGSYTVEARWAQSKDFFN